LQVTPPVRRSSEEILRSQDLAQSYLEVRLLTISGDDDVSQLEPGLRRERTGLDGTAHDAIVRVHSKLSGQSRSERGL
jgi:hypothetical protein